MLKNSYDYYNLGAILYLPGNFHNLKNLLNNTKSEYNDIKSIAIDFEDALDDSLLEVAYTNVLSVFNELKNNNESIQKKNVFIRIKRIEDLQFLHSNNIFSVIDGIIIPKLSLEQIYKFFPLIDNNINEIKYLMLILEDAFSIKDLVSIKELIKTKFPKIDEKILSYRIGATDILSNFHLRRNKENVIYDFLYVKNVISNILEVFGKEYNISAPVYEYFNDEVKTLDKELEMDLLNGLYAKTTIHPNQIAIIHCKYAVSPHDVESANLILNENFAAIGKTKEQRMEEKNTHTNWAKIIKLRESIYGIRKIEKDEEKEIC